MAHGDSLEAQIERQMMALGSGIITDLDRFMMPRIEDCDMDGREIDRRGRAVSSRHCPMSGTMYYDEFGEEC